MTGYTKLFSSIVASTIWREDDKTRIVWITMLALSDRDGVVEGSIPGLADLARVTIEECEQSLTKLQQPDKYSRTPDHDGRRIEVIDGGWFIINRAKYRDLVPDEQRRERDRLRQQRHRQGHCGKVTLSRVTGCDSHETSHQKEKETKTETEKIKSKNTIAPNGACERIYHAYPKHVAKTAVLKAIAKAIGTIQKQKAVAAEDAADFLYSQVAKFSQSPAGRQGQYTPHCATWMNAGRYFDDPNEWHAVNQQQGSNANGNRAQQQQDSNIEAGRKAIEILKRRREAREDNPATDSTGGGVQGDIDSGVHGHLFGKPI